jgi:hypothetical protein
VKLTDIFQNWSLLLLCQRSCCITPTLLPCVFLSRPRFSAKENFFKFRVSPIVSGAVYVSYMVFLITVLDRTVGHPAVILWFSLLR